MEKKETKIKKKRTLLQKIVNIFLYTMLGIFLLLVIVFGITQTSTFREYLRTTAIELANENLNGTVYIEKIEGTIFTSLILRKTIINMGTDTLLNAGKIEIRTSPLQILFKIIKVRKAEISDATIALVTDSTGEVNIKHLLPPSKEDSLKSSFPFQMVVNSFTLSHVDFYFQRYDKVGSKALYDVLNMTDLRVQDINLDLSAFADIDNNEFEVELKNLSLKPNLNKYNLKRLSGSFAANTKELYARDITFETDNSEVVLNVNSKGYNLFDSTADFTTAKLFLKVDSDKFDFADISPFVKSMEMVKKPISFYIETEGTLKELALNNIEVRFQNTLLKSTGYARNLDEPEKMYINTDFSGSYINQNDLKDLLSGLTIPTYPQYGVINFDTLTFSGGIKKFASRIDIKTDKGELYAVADLNMENKDMVYDINLITSGLDISPFVSIPAVLNSRALVKGTGTSPDAMDATVEFDAAGSVLKGIRMDTLKLNAEAGNKIISYNLNIASDTLGADLTGKFNFAQKDNPAYNFTGNVRSLNLMTFGGDSSMNSNLNFTINAEGQSFDVDNIDLYTSIFLKNSVINGIFIDSTRAIADLRKDEGGGRVINIISDLADVTVTGNFSISQMSKIITEEINLITKISKEKADEIISPNKPPELGDMLVKNISDIKTVMPETDSVTNLRYLVEFKDFALLSLFLGNAQIELDGEMSGNIKNTHDSIFVNYNTNISYVKYRAQDNVFFLSNMNLDLNLQNSHTSQRLEDIYLGLHVTTDRIFTGGDIHELQLDMDLQNKFAKLNFSARMENAAALIKGGIDLRSNAVKILLDTLNINYMAFKLKNKETVDIEYKENIVDIKSFILSRDGANLSIKGTWARNGNNNININMSGLRGKDISTSILNLRPENALEALFSMNVDITGTMSDPLFNVKFLIDSVKYKNKTFGSMMGLFDYKQKNLSIDVQFKDSLINANSPALTISGIVPLNIDLQNGGDMFSENNPMEIRLLADNFNVGAFGDILPAVNKLRGILAADLKVTGVPGNLIPSGFINLKNGGFVAEANNLEYNTEFEATLDNEDLNIKKIVLQNIQGTENGGTFTGSGKAVLQNFNIVSSDFKIAGELKLLSDASKSASPYAYGDLVIATNGDVEFTMNEDGTFLKAPIIVKIANLTFPPTQSSYKNNSNNFVYKYVTDTTLGRKADMDFESLVSYSKEASKKNESGKTSVFDYSIDVTLQNEATIIFVLSREFNQNLTAVLEGNLTYESIGGRPSAQGELTLLEGSTLEFIKTLSADGTIRFDNEITNPNLDITATYLGYYYPADSSANSIQEEEVAVKIKIKGPLKDLDKNFIKEENNIAVYVGTDNIENDIPDKTKDASDAAMFLVAGKFRSEMTPQDKSAASGQVSGTATSLAGSIIGGFLNNQLGDYVKSVELRRVGSSTKFNVSGRFNKIRYSIGGTTDVFQDLSQANIRFEYPFTNSLLLRLERKQAITETTSSNEMINELGLKYKFEF